ncbi:MAG: hypothetical protein ACXADL_11295 [Candidatus Thorarchaeota archaeon]
MGRNKKYSGYKAYDYLKPGTDYRTFNLREPIRKDWAYKVPLSKKASSFVSRGPKRGTCSKPRG